MALGGAGDGGCRSAVASASAMHMDGSTSAPSMQSSAHQQQCMASPTGFRLPPAATCSASASASSSAHSGAASPAPLSPAFNGSASASASGPASPISPPLSAGTVGHHALQKDRRISRGKMLMQHARACDVMDADQAAASSSSSSLASPSLSSSASSAASASSASCIPSPAQAFSSPPSSSQSQGTVPPPLSATLAGQRSPLVASAASAGKCLTPGCACTRSGLAVADRSADFAFGLDVSRKSDKEGE